MHSMIEADAERRLTRLERECRVFRGAVTLGIVGLLAVAAMGQAAPPPKVVKAESFEVVDGEGKVLCRIGPDGPMRCTLKFLDAKDEPQVALGAFPEGGGVIAIMQTTDEPACVLSHQPGKVSGLTLFLNGRDHVAALNANDRGAAVLCRSGGVDASMGILSANAEISVGRVLESGNSRPSASIIRFANGDTSLKVWDREGKLIHDIPEGSHPEANPK